MIYFYEEGRHTPAPQRLERLASALGCEVEALTGVSHGQETLIDLRYAAGLTLERVVKLLRSSVAGRELCVSEPKIAPLEHGHELDGRHWQDPEMTGRLLAPLAKAYAVPVRMVLDAWMRTRPGEPVPILGRPRTPAVPRAPLAVWESLNERQQTYLGEIMRDDRMIETEMWMRRVQRLPIPSATKWRRLPLAQRAEHLGRPRLVDEAASGRLHRVADGARATRSLVHSGCRPGQRVSASLCTFWDCPMSRSFPQLVWASACASSRARRRAAIAPRSGDALTAGEPPLRTSYRIGDYETCPGTKEGVPCACRVGHDPSDHAGQTR